MSRETFRQLSRYSLIGVTGVAIDICLFLLLHYTLGVDKQVANVVSITVAIINNFWWNALFTFDVRDRLLVRFLLFYSVGALGIALTAVILWVLVDQAGWNAAAAKAASLPAVLVVQFALNRSISFRSHPSGAGGQA